VPAPGGLGSNYNYFLYRNCEPLLDVSVTIIVTEDIICESTSGPITGLSFQLNAYSPGGERIAFQQYAIVLEDSELCGFVDNWPNTGEKVDGRYLPEGAIIFQRVSLTSVPNAATLPAGYRLEISLRNNAKWRSSWDLAVPGSWAGPGKSGLLLYDRAAGVGAFYAINSQVWMDLLHQYDDWRPSWDLAVTGGWAGVGDSGLLLYDRSAGLAAIYAIDKQGQIGPPLHEEETRRTWDLAVTGGWAGPGNSGLLLYDRAAGLAAFYAITDQAQMKLLHEEETRPPASSLKKQRSAVHGAVLRPSWDLAVTGGWAGPGNSGLLLYDRAAGLVAFYAIDSQGRMDKLHEEKTRETWDLAVTGGWAGPRNSGLLLYDRAAGVGAFYAIDGQGVPTPVEEYRDWRSSWDLAVTGGWAGPGDSGLLLYDRAAGVGAFYAIDSQCRMDLLQQYDDSVSGVTYSVTDTHGRTLANHTTRLESISGGTAGHLSPIVAFTLDLVGPGNGESVVLSSGGGQIVYSSASPLTVVPDRPQCAVFEHGTAETANSVYGLLPPFPANTFTQSFAVTDEPPRTRDRGKVFPSLILRSERE
jgi:hypothetical protein